MPQGMFLRSSPSASNLADPDGQLRLDRYHALHGIPHAKPTPLEDFVRYGQWFQEQAVPDVDRRAVTHVAVNSQGFRVRLADGEEFHARRVVVATGISPFARRPPEFAGLPAPLVSHSFDPADLRRFAGRPAGASWLAARLAWVPVTAGRTIAAASPTGSGLRLRLTDGTERLVDHLLLATGYRVDAARYAFLAPTVLQALRTRDGYPELDVGFESSVPGLHFLGTPAAGSFGPLCRFVVGTRYMARTLTRHVTRRHGNGRVRHG